jgi:NitT/TauT family transport system substrate-binding protein
MCLAFAEAGFGIDQKGGPCLPPIIVRRAAAMAKPSSSGRIIVVRTSIRLLFVAVFMLVFGSAARAETGELRIAVQYGLQYLPLLIMQHDQLIEKHVEAAGLPRPTVTWRTFSGGDVLAQALLSGQIDIINGGLSAFLTLWAKTEGDQKVVAIAPFNSLPVTLVTRDPKIKTIKDYKPTDKIALPAVRLSGNAILLEMEAEKVLGSWDALDKSTISRSQPDALAAFMDDTSGISSHFGNSPYTELELKRPGAHIVLTERDVLGDTFSGGLCQTTMGFHKANPKTTKAYFDALVEAMGVIKTDKPRAAKIFLELARDKKDSVEDIVALLSQENMIYEVKPLNIVRFADFMNHIGQISAKPGSWRDLFLPYVQDLQGS